jgi:hypothetical protein
MRNLTGKFSRKPSGTASMISRDHNQDGAVENVFSPDLLGEDVFARSEIFPENSPYRLPATQRIIWLSLIVIILATSSWFCFIGPGAPIIKDYLENSAGRTLPVSVVPFTPTEPTTTETRQIGSENSLDSASQEPEQTITPTPLPTATLTFTPTLIPTETPTQTTEPSPTPVPIQNTPTPTSEVAGCVPASEVKLSDVGSTLCVSGRVFRTIDKPSGFLIIVVEEPEAFYFVAYDLTFPELDDPKNKNQCVYAIGEIRQLGYNPIMVVSYSIPLQYCSP